MKLFIMEPWQSEEQFDLVCAITTRFGSTGPTKLDTSYAHHLAVPLAARIDSLAIHSAICKHL